MYTGDEFNDFNVKNISKKQLQKLRVDANSGYKEIGQRYNAWGAKRGDYNKGTNFGYYQNHQGWLGIAKELGIKSIDSNNDISQMYDFTNSYSRSAAFAPYIQQLQATSAKSQADIAKQLRIVQNEKSAVAKLSQNYTDMLKKEAEARTKRMEEEKVAAATSAANQSRQGQTNNLQIQPASQASKISGTKVFKKRGLSQFMSGISGMVNI